MKRITCAFLSMLLITPCMANIHINPDAVTEVVAKYFPKKQVECIREYNAQLKASNGAGIVASKLWNVCAAGGLDIKQSTDKEKCRTFVNELVSKGTVKFYAACGKDSKVSGAVCVRDFAGLTVNRLQAQGLAKLYARNKSDNTIQCNVNPRIESTTTTSNNPHVIGMSSTSSIPYLQCTSYNSNKFYEFRFTSVYGSIDATNHKNFKKGICGIFGYKYISKKPEAPADNLVFDICDGIKDESACDKLDQAISSGNIGYVASWGPSGYKLGKTGYRITSKNFPYCILNESISKDRDEYLLVERAPFNLDGRVFLNAGIQRKGSNEIKKQIRAYVENTMGKENVKSFSCEDTYHTIRLRDRSGKDDMLRCTVNDKVVEFFFDDLSEAWGAYDKSGREAMNCIAWGGTFTGKQCIGLDKKMCDTVRDANAQSCPECEQIKWNDKEKVCELPASVSATNLKRGLAYTAIVGGAVVSVVVTVGSLGTATAPTVLVLTGLAVETMGSVIELKAQHAIYAKTDEFFKKANACDNQNCAETLIKEYLQALSNQSSNMEEAELNAADKIFANLFDKIPADSEFYKDILNEGIKGETIASNKRGFFDAKSWNPEQVWLAVGVSLQIIPTLASVGWRIAKQSNKLVKSTAKLQSKLDDASKHIDDAAAVATKADDVTRQIDALGNSARVAKDNTIDYNKLSDIDKEWDKLRQEYAPKNQTLEQFKKDWGGGDLNKAKEELKDLIGRSQSEEILVRAQKARAELPRLEEEVDKAETAFYSLKDKVDYDLALILEDDVAREAAFKKYPNLKKAYKDWKSAELRLQAAKVEKEPVALTYSTFDPEYSKMAREYNKKYTKADEDYWEWWRNEWDKAYSKFEKKNPSAKIDDFYESEAYKQFQKKSYQKKDDLVGSVKHDFQFEAAERFPLENLGNVVNERVEQYRQVLEMHPEYKQYLDKWDTFSQDERADILNKLQAEFSKQNNLPVADISAKDFAPGENGGAHQITGTNKIEFNKKADNLERTPLNTISHEYGHYIDDTVPNEGALGAQKASMQRLYSSDVDKGYYLAHTEQSSYKIGDKVGEELHGESAFSGTFDEEIMAAEQSQLYRNATPPIKEETTKGVTRGIVGGVGLGGIMVAGKTILDNKNEKGNNEKSKEMSQDQKDEE